MLSIQKKFLFIHIPKTGGNSIQSILRSYSEDVIVPNDGLQDPERFGVFNHKYNTLKHSELKYYKKSFPPILYKSLYKFSVIRNPWERLISWYFSPHRGVTQFNRSMFIKFIKQKRQPHQFLIIPKFWDRFSNKPILLDRDIDYLIRFENLDGDFLKVCNILDIPYRPLPHINQSDREHYSVYYDDELIDLVRIISADEIRFGQYEFEYK